MTVDNFLDWLLTEFKVSLCNDEDCFEYKMEPMS